MTIDEEAETREVGIVSNAEIFFYSSAFGMTAALAEKLPFKAERIRGSYRKEKSNPIVAANNYVLLVPTYKTENDNNYIPRCIKEFLLTHDNYKSMVGVIGIGNKNFGSDYNKAADEVHNKFGTPILGKVELSGTSEEVEILTERINDIFKRKSLELISRF